MVESRRLQGLLAPECEEIQLQKTIGDLLSVPPAKVCYSQCSHIDGMSGLSIFTILHGYKRKR